MLGDAAASELGSAGWKDWKGLGLSAEADISGGTVRLLKPSTFMNLSGRAAAAMASFYKIPAESLLIIYDDIDMDFGRLRFRTSGSAGGHRGMDSVISCMGSAAISRMKLGVGPRPPYIDAKNFVLGKFSKEEEVLLPAFIDRSLEALRSAFEEGVENAMNRWNGNATDKPVH